MRDLARLAASPQDIDDSIDICLGALAHAIRDCGRSSPPGDAAIARILSNLKALAEIRIALTGPPLVEELPIDSADAAELTMRKLSEAELFGEKPAPKKRGRPRKQKDTTA